MFSRTVGGHSGLTDPIRRPSCLRTESLSPEFVPLGRKRLLGGTLMDRGLQLGHGKPIDQYDCECEPAKRGHAQAGVWLQPPREWTFVRAATDGKRHFTAMDVNNGAGQNRLASFAHEHYHAHWAADPRARRLCSTFSSAWFQGKAFRSCVVIRRGRSSGRRHLPRCSSSGAQPLSHS
jgi:hypothetical protein